MLTDGAIGSSGEAAVIAFVKRPETRSFGRATCGLSTANQGFPLSDGSTLVLTTAVMADREQSPFGGPVAPDEVVAASDVFDRAVDWLRTGR